MFSRFDCFNKDWDYWITKVITVYKFMYKYFEKLFDIFFNMKYNNSVLEEGAHLRRKVLDSMVIDNF